MLGAVVTCLWFVWLYQGSAPQIVTVDLKALVRNQISTELLATLSEAEIEAKLTALIREQKQLINKVMGAENVIVLSKQAVITPVQDITDIIKAPEIAASKTQRESP